MFGFFKPDAGSTDDFEREALPLMPDVYRVAVWLTRDVSEAEDLTQETFAQAFKSFHGYERGTNCKAWLMTILHHANSKRLRLKLRLQLVEDPEEKIAATLAFEPPIPQGITDEEILASLRKVPEQFRQIVLLADVEDLTYKEVSDIMKIPLGTVMSRLHRGRKLLRLELAETARGYGIGLAQNAANKAAEN
jgi:RNA polymerase sigma-70 factor (ECF subfamily)